MKKHEKSMWDGMFMLGILLAIFFLNIIMQRLFSTRTLTPMIFVLGVFIVSLRTEGYLWGIAASMISVLAVNYAFTFPYYAFDLITPDNFFSAVVMLLVAILTSALITKIKKQEKVRIEGERERMRANLLRAISHDLRTPLTSIYGACSAIMENYDSLSKQQQMKLLGEVQTDSQWLIRMVENLLSVTRIDGDKVRVAKTPTVLEELIDAVLVKFRKNHPEQNVLVEIPEDFISIPMDAILIEQVLINLLENAVIHAKGLTFIRLAVRENNNRAVFWLEDDGCGIPEENLPRIFGGYLTQDNVMDGTRHNMGIGLSVCAAIIKAHGGEIWAENRKEGGARFCFWLEKETLEHGE